MSDHTDDAPRERYEGPMASAVKAETPYLPPDPIPANEKKRLYYCSSCHKIHAFKCPIASDPGATGSAAKAETVMSASAVAVTPVPSHDARAGGDLLMERVLVGGEACGGTGFFDARHSDRFCPTCDGAGIKPALGHGASGLPKDASYPDVFKCNSKECGAMSCRQELEAGSCACGASVTPIHDVSRDQYRAFLKAQNANVAQSAKIAEQSAEIERLKAERDTHLCPLCHGTGMTGNVNDREACERCEGTGIDAYTEMIAELTTNRDALRLEVLRLNDLKCEAMDRYAALEAERDALKRAIDAAMRTIAAQSSTLFEDWP